jgi:hypothetical protein
MAAAASSSGRRRKAARPAEASTPPVVLTGPPTALRGQASMANTSDQRIAVRGGDLHLDGLDPVSLSLGVVLPPGTESDVALGVDLGSTTPPGTYEGSLDVGGLSRPALVRVDVVVDLDVRPDTLVAVEGRTTARLRLTNQGNTTIRLAPLVRGRLKAHDADPDDAALDAELHVDDGIGVVAPGSERDLDVVVVVPPGLDPTRRHRALLPIGPADLVLTVLPWGATQEPAAAPRSSRPAKKSPSSTTPSRSRTPRRS